MKNIIISNNVIKKNKKIIFNSLIKKLGFKKISKKKFIISKDVSLNFSKKNAYKN